jgi:hypothetical protein
MGEYSRNVVLPRFGQLETPKLKGIIPPPAVTEQPDDGLMRIKGSGAAVINLNHSESYNYSRSVVKETKRTYDEVRIKNPDDPEQHVDVQRPRKINTQSNEATTGAPRKNTGATGPANVTTIYAKQAPQDNVEVLRENVEEKNPDYDRGEGGSAAP